MKTKNCPRCGGAFQTKVGDRFCKSCRSVVKAELQSSGYLQQIPRQGLLRSVDCRQAYHDDPSPWAENATRLLEGE